MPWQHLSGVVLPPAIRHFWAFPADRYSVTSAGGIVNLTLSNIQVSPPNGVVSTGQFKFVVADAESSNNGESLTFVTNCGAWTLVDQVPPTTRSIYPMASGTGTATFTTTGLRVRFNLGFANALAFHLSDKLFGNNFLDRSGSDFLTKTLLVKPTLKT